MNKLLAVGAMLCSAPALAQSSVQLYGLIDLGVVHVTNANGTADSNTAMGNSNLAATRWGLRGTEDLVGGLSAFFRFEASWNANDGTAGVDAVYAFHRSSIVGLRSKDWGELKLGRDPAPIFYANLFTTDRITTGSATVNSLGHNAYNGPGAAGRLNNSVTYTTPSFAGFSASLAVADSGQGSKRPHSGNLVYRSKDLTAALGYAKTNAQTPTGGVAAGNAVRESTLLGLKYRGLKSWEFYGGFSNNTLTSLAGVRTADFSFYWLGTNYEVTAPLTLKAALYRRDNRNSSNDANLFSVSGEYDLSKRTTLYLKADQVKNKGTANFGVAQNALTLPGETSTQLSMGVLHTF